MKLCNHKLQKGDSEPACSVSENKPKETGGIFSFGSTGGGGGSSSGSTPFSFGAKTAAPTSSAAKTELPKPDVTGMVTT